MSSPYVPTTWITGDVVTAPKANNWETQYADVFDSGDKSVAANWAWTSGKKISGAAINPREQTTASASTVTPAPDTADIVTITAQAASLTLANPTPVATVVQGTRLVVRIKDDGTARSIAYGTKYRAAGIPLPTTTIVGTTHYLEFEYNATDDKWDAVNIQPNIMIKSIQRDTITITDGNASNTKTVTAVDTSKATLHFLGSSDASNTDAGSIIARVVLTNSTTVTATRGGSVTGSCVVSFELVEYY